MAKTLHSEIPGKFAGVINDEALQRCAKIELEGREQRRDIGERLKENHATVKNIGVSVPIFLGIVRELEMDADQRAALYMAQDDLRRRLGALEGTPLGEAAMRQVEPQLNGHAPKVGRPTRKFAEQPVGSPRRPRGRPRKDALQAARDHLGPGDGKPLFE
jgi:hypothetical protein